MIKQKEYSFQYSDSRNGDEKIQRRTKRNPPPSRAIFFFIPRRIDRCDSKQRDLASPNHRGKIYFGELYLTLFFFSFFLSRDSLVTQVLRVY